MKQSVLITSLIAVLALGGAAGAQNFPASGRTITTIVPSTAGGGADSAARMLAPLLEKELGVPVDIVNKPGASMQIGLTAAATAKPDGYTLVWSILPTATSIYLDSERKSTFSRDSLKPIANYYNSPTAIAVPGSSPIKTLADLIAAAKANPGKLKSGTTGFMATGHFANLAVQLATNIHMSTVNFQGGGPQVTALLGSHIDVAFTSFGEVVSHHKSGALRIIALVDSKRSALLPDVPTVDESGFKVGLIGSSTGLSAPAGTPDAIVERLSKALQKASQDETLKKQMFEVGNNVEYLGPQDYKKFWDAIDVQYKPLIDAARKQSQ